MEICFYVVDSSCSIRYDTGHVHDDSKLIFHDLHMNTASLKIITFTLNSVYFILPSN